ncbi:MAG TPA: hypothetical protein VI159_05315 [Gemmatimonadales bacterium]
MRFLVRAVAALGVPLAILGACHDGTDPGTPPSDPWAKLTMDDGVTDYPSWGGLDLLRDQVGALHLVVVEHEYGKLQYGECTTSCDHRGGWTLTTVDSGPYQGLGENASSVLTPSSIVTVYEDQTGGVATYQLKLATCSANCTIGTNWQKTDLFSGELDGWQDPIHSRDLAVDPSGGLHMLYRDTSWGIWYASCASGCATAGSWHQLHLETSPSFALYQGSNAAIAVDSHSAIHVLLRTSDTTQSLVYLECATQCDSTANWGSVVLAHGGTGFEPALTTSGSRVAVAFRDPVRPGYTTALHFGRCDSSCTSAGSWTMQSPGIDAGYDVALAFDAAGRPWLATNHGTTSYYNGSTLLARCSLTCASAGDWSALTIDSLGDGGGVSFVFDAAGLPRLAVSGMGVHYAQTADSTLFR